MGALLSTAYSVISGRSIPDALGNLGGDMIQRAGRNDPHVPTESDVEHVRETLLEHLPLEIVDLILHDAEYWPVLICHTESTPVRSISATHYSHFIANYCYFITPRIPEQGLSGGRHLKIEKVVYRLKSRDQGIGGDPGMTEPYMGSWTWFEAAIVRGLGGDDIINAPDEAARAIEGSSHPAQNSVSTTASSLPSDVKAPHQVRNPVDGSRVWMLQRNRRANPFEALHEIIWRKITAITESDIDMNEALDKTGAGTGVGFVDQLQPGDRIAIYARAQYPGWINHVRGVEVQMYYSQ